MLDFANLRHDKQYDDRNCQQDYSHRILSKHGWHLRKRNDITAYSPAKVRRMANVVAFRLHSINRIQKIDDPKNKARHKVNFQIGLY